ncbi:methylated-DNA--[protein]-cysteine S-methyltransferase [Parapusillimonas sp. JC17]|uniref:methylated-DNA--[protein]-cysteine S-methyltransferase n=1 Tax=Parapusillimonas sp. JC17 TaxID=3445768 RepID=UPI003FA07A2B
MAYHAQLATSLGTMLFRSDGEHLTGLFFIGQKDCPSLPGLPEARPERRDPTAGLMGGRPIKNIRIGSSQGELPLCDAESNGGASFQDSVLPKPSIPPGSELLLMQDGTPSSTLDLFRASAAELAEYFSGERKVFSLPLKLEGSGFQKEVWDALLAIPYGHCVSYKDVTLSAGKTAQHVRAVGSAVGRNPVSIIVPCHRVLSSAGTLNGYTGGLDRKYALLQLEGWGQTPNGV